MITWRRVVTAMLAAYALLFIALSVDILFRVWDWRFRLESSLDVAALFYFEGMRTLTTLAGVGIALLASRRVRQRAGLQELPLAILLATIAYTKVVAFRGFPGAQQERAAAALQQASVPPVILEFVFAQPAWTAWLALAALALLFAHFPRTLTPDELSASGSADRRGAMRDVALAGTDIGQLSRRAAMDLLGRHWIRPHVAYGAAAAVALLHTLLARHTGGLLQLLVHALAAAAAAAGLAVCLALYRAGARVAAGHEAAMLSWLRRGALAGTALFAFSGLSAIALRGSVISVAALSLAPAAVLAGLVLSLRHTAPYGEAVEVAGGIS